MQLVRIFVMEDQEDGIWSIQLKQHKESEFDRFFNLMNDPLYLYNFFEEHKPDLMAGFWGKISTEDAVLRTLEEVEEMETVLYDYSEQGFLNNGTCLQHLFKPLNNFEYSINLHQKSKARYKRSWLRLYAIRLSQNCYLITGGSIKLTLDMKRPHLQYELMKLEQAKTFLAENNIVFPEDLNSNHHG